MVFIRLLLFIFLFNLFSCAKVSYLWDQGWGQVSLFSRGKKNEDILKDVRISPGKKEKIKNIQTYKKHFYEYWKKKPAAIYEETTFLKQKAVTYLVIASPHNEIKAREECFPFMGCFPYLGFFSEKKANRHAQELEEESWVTYVRPVYAYSTLGYFNDNILSSFFYYNDYDLAELVFHELFHTIFFIKGEVDLNENLANYFGKEMALEYFKVTKEERAKRESQKEKQEKLNQRVVKLANELNDLYAKRSPRSKTESQELFKGFYDNTFLPEVKELCSELEMKQCSILQRKWNNASLAAFLTYEKAGNDIEALRKRHGLGLKEFFFFIEKKYKTYEKEDPDESFTKYLLEAK